MLVVDSKKSKDLKTPFVIDAAEELYSPRMLRDLGHRGLIDPAYHCPACKGSMVLNWPNDLDKIRPYFSHKAETSQCTVSPAQAMTLLHRYAQMHLAKIKTITLPALSSSHVVGVEQVSIPVVPEQVIVADTAHLEHKVGDTDRIADVVFVKGNRVLNIEVLVKHAVSHKKRQELAVGKHATIEIDLSKLPRGVGAEDIEEALATPELIRWVYHPAMRGAFDELKAACMIAATEAAKVASVQMSREEADANVMQQRKECVATLKRLRALHRKQRDNVRDKANQQINDAENIRRNALSDAKKRAEKYKATLKASLAEREQAIARNERIAQERLADSEKHVAERVALDKYKRSNGRKYRQLKVMEEGISERLALPNTTKAKLEQLKSVATAETESARAEAIAKLDDTKTKCVIMVADTKTKCATMIADAKTKCATMVSQSDVPKLREKLTTEIEAANKITRAATAEAATAERSRATKADEEARVRAYTNPFVQQALNLADAQMQWESLPSYADSNLRNYREKTLISERKKLQELLVDFTCRAP